MTKFIVLAVATAAALLVAISAPAKVTGPEAPFGCDTRTGAIAGANLYPAHSFIDACPR